MSNQKSFASRTRAASGSSAETARPGDEAARLHRVSWKQALGKIVSPAIRLHHYRSVHNRLLQDAFCELDRPRGGECNA
jgi:hypothetical protein